MKYKEAKLPPGFIFCVSKLALVPIKYNEITNLVYIEETTTLLVFIALTEQNIRF